MISSMVRVPAIALAAAVTLLAAGCGSSGSSSSSGAEIPTLAKVGGLEKTTLSVAAVPAMDSAGFFVAIHDGLFQQEGLTIKYEPATSSDTVIGSQILGKYDITAGNYVSYVQAQAEGKADKVGGLKIIAEGSVMEQGSQVVLTMPNSHITSLKELAGHTLGVNAPGNIDYLLSASALTENGISVNPPSHHFSSSAVNYPAKPIPFPNMGTALASGQISAAVVPEPFASLLAENLGAVTIADLNQGATTEFPIEGFVATGNWAKANPNTLKAFQTALEAGQEIADTDRAAVEQAFESLNGAPNGQVNAVIASMMALNNYPLTIDPTRLQRVANVMQQFGLLNEHFNISTMLGS